MYSEYEESEVEQFSEGQCGCREEVIILQQKLSEVHEKLMRQIDACQEQQMHINDLNKKLHSMESSQNLLAFSSNYDSFGCKPDTPPAFNQKSSNIEESRELYLNKYQQSLQSDLEAMRKRIIIEITQKNKLVQEIISVKKDHRKEIALQIKKFEGLQILYNKLYHEKRSPLQSQQPTKSQNTRENLQMTKMKAKIQEVESKYIKQRQKSKGMQRQNRQLIEQLKVYENNAARSEERGDSAYCLKEENLGLSKYNQLRQINQLKEQISKLNQTFEIQDKQLRQNSRQRQRMRQKGLKRKVFSPQKKLNHIYY